VRLAGDLDWNGEVDAADLARLLRAVGRVTPRGGVADPSADLNADGVVDRADLDLLLANFGGAIEREAANDPAAFGFIPFCPDGRCWDPNTNLCVPCDFPDGDPDGGDGDGVGGKDGTGATGGGGSGSGGGGGGGDGPTGGCDKLIGPEPGAGRVLDAGASYIFWTGKDPSVCDPSWTISAGEITVLTTDGSQVSAVFTEVSDQTISSGCNCTTLYKIGEVVVTLDGDAVPHPEEGEPPFHVLLVNDDDDNANGVPDYAEASGAEFGLATDDDWIPVTLGPLEGASAGFMSDPHWTVSTGGGVRVWYRVDEGDLHDAAGATVTASRVLDGVEYRVVPSIEIPGAPDGARTFFAEAIVPSPSLASAWIECAVFGTGSIVPSGQTEPVEY